MTPAIEPFLRTIFADPADTLPRLVFADWLDDHDYPGWAEVIRLGCELDADMDRGDEYRELHEDRLKALIAHHDVPYAGVNCGFQPSHPIELTADAFRDADAFRALALTRHPHWYGATAVKVTGGRITQPDPLVTILTSPVTERVTELDLRGQVLDVPLDDSTGLGDVEPGSVLPMYDIEQHPVITVKMAEAMCQMRECRRLVRLDLRNNDLDNDALRALAQSPYLHRLDRLKLLEGNRFKGRAWQQILAQFGPDVVT